MRILATTLTLLSLIACKGDKPKLEIDAVVVAERMDHIEANVPSCHATLGSGSSMARTGPSYTDQVIRTSTHTIREVLEVMRLLNRENTGYAGVSSTGTCGGALDVSFDHASGTTDYEAIMADYCVSGAEGNTVYNGRIVAKEVGRPSDNGPIIRSLELSTDGAVTLTQGTQTLEITVEDVQTDYGVPSEWEPGFPDASNPDKTRVGAVRVVYPATGREDYVEDLEIERTSGLPATVHILSGRSGTVGDDVANVRTTEDDPLILDVYNGTLQGGTLEVEGARDTLVTVSPRPGTPGVYDLTLNGAPYDQSIDCSSGEGPKSQTVQALLQALPVY